MYKEDDTYGTYRKLGDDHRSEDDIRQERYDNRTRPLSYAFGSHSFRETADWDKGQSLILLKKARSRNSLNLPRNFDLDADLNANAKKTTTDNVKTSKTLFDDTQNVSPGFDFVPDSDIVQLEDKCIETHNNNDQTQVKSQLKTSQNKTRSDSSSSSSSSSNSSESNSNKGHSEPKPFVRDSNLRTSLRGSNWNSRGRTVPKRSLGSSGSYDSQSSCPTSMHDQSFDEFEYREPKLIFSTLDTFTPKPNAFSQKGHKEYTYNDDEDFIKIPPIPKSRVTLKDTVPALSPRTKSQTSSLPKPQHYEPKFESDDAASIASEIKFQELLDDLEDRRDCVFDSDLHFVPTQIEEEGGNVDDTLLKDDDERSEVENKTDQNAIEDLLVSNFVSDLNCRKYSIESIESGPPPLPASEPPLIGDYSIIENIEESFPLSSQRISSGSDLDTVSTHLESDDEIERVKQEAEAELKMASGGFVMEEHEPVTEVAYYGPIYAKRNTLILPSDLLPRDGSMDPGHEDQVNEHCKYSVVFFKF